MASIIPELLKICGIYKTYINSASNLPVQLLCEAGNPVAGQVAASSILDCIAFLGHLYRDQPCTCYELIVLRASAPNKRVHKFRKIAPQQLNWSFFCET
jgi:hypothetical protein